MIVIPRGELDTFARLERQRPGDGFSDAGEGAWELVDQIWVGLRDDLPSRRSAPTDGFPASGRRTRVRMDWRDDVAVGMRLVVGDRTVKLVAGPAELGRRAGIEFAGEEPRPGGYPA